MRIVTVVICLVLLGACEREKREFRPSPLPRSDAGEISMTTISAGPAPPVIRPSNIGKTYEENAYQISQGKKLYVWFNCNGCHANGGGDSGPPLIDDRWIYGGAIENIVATIREGRPNGMPSFRGKIPDEQIWQIAGYVRSMGANVPSAAAPGRNDDLQALPAEQRRTPAPPTSGGTLPPPPQAR
jgi:cytochrome c oxidase cbb3-type subunit III